MSRGLLRSLMAVGVAALVVVTTGCGSHKPSALAVGDCIANAQHGRMVRVFNRLIAHGTFTRAQIVKHFPSSLSQDKYLNAAGRLRPFGQLTTDAQVYFVSWAQQLESTKAPYADSLYRADTAVSEAMRRTCGATS